MLASKLLFILDDLLWVLTDSQLKAIIHYAKSLSEAMEKSTQQRKSMTAESLQVLYLAYFSLFIGDGGCKNLPVLVMIMKNIFRLYTSLFLRCVCMYVCIDICIVFMCASSVILDCSSLSWHPQLMDRASAILHRHSYKYKSILWSLWCQGVFLSHIYITLGPAHMQWQFFNGWRLDGNKSPDNRNC